MAAKRTDMHRLQDLVRLYRMGVGGRERARLLGMGRNTEKAYRHAIAKAGLLDGAATELPSLETLRGAIREHAPSRPSPQQQSSVEHWRPRVAELLEASLGPKAIFDRLRLERDDFTGSRGAIRRLCLRLEREHGPRARDVAIPVETAPGEVAQVDFGYVGYLFDPEQQVLRRAWVFVMVLGHSRHQFARVVFDQRIETWLRLHAEAFEWFGGVIETVVPDNLKAAVVRAAFGVDGDTGLNRSYREFARFYDFKVDPAPPRQARKKGKVEAGVKYVKRNFFKGRSGADVRDVNRELERWVREIAGTRIHGTTGRKPLEVFAAEERQVLKPLPAKPWEPVVWKQATVHGDCHVAFERRLYSVPWQRVGSEVWLRATPHTIAVYFDDERIATHERRGPGYRSTRDEHLPDERAPLRHRSRSYWEERADRLGDDVGRYIREVFDSDDVLSQLRTVQAIVTHLEKFPPERAAAACQRASFYGSYRYSTIKNILTQALDLEPLPTTRTEPLWADAAPRFARDVRELARHSLEVTREHH